MRQLFLLLFAALLVQAVGYAPISLWGLSDEPITNVTVTCDTCLGSKANIQNTSEGSVFVATVTVPDSQRDHTIRLIVLRQEVWIDESFSLQAWQHYRVGASEPQTRETQTESERPNSPENEFEIRTLASDVESKNFTALEQHTPIIIEKKDTKEATLEAPSVSYLPFLAGIAIIFIGVHLLRSSRL
ncbi:MAG: hypothetical protein ACQESG_03860 [Nanobdellota archaeon]